MFSFVIFSCLFLVFFFFFFFKQKTAYEMRISDWSSDVCSSDLLQDIAQLTRIAGPAMSHQLLHGLGRRPDESRLIRLLAQKQRGGAGANVLPTHDQRLPRKRHDIKPPVKVGTELQHIALSRPNADVHRQGTSSHPSRTRVATQ